jgi:hypothetical protein
MLISAGYVGVTGTVITVVVAGHVMVITELKVVSEPAVHALTV